MSTSAKIGQLVLSGLPVMAAGALVGAVAVWTAGGRGHWFLRTSALVAIVALSLLVFPQQAMLGLAVESATVVLGLKGFRVIEARSWTRRDGAPRSLNEPGRYQFSLRDLLLAVIVVAMAAGLMAQIPVGAWIDVKWIALYGAWFGVLTLVAVSMVYGQRRSNEGKPPWLPPRNTVRTVCIGGLAGFVIAVALDALHRAWSEVTAATIANLSLVALAFALVGYLNRRSHHKRQAAGGDELASHPPKPLTRRRRALQIAAIIFCMAVVSLKASIIAGLYLASLPTTESPVRLPDAPGYIALLEAAALCPDRSAIDVWKAGPAELAGFVNRSGDALASARQALGQECHVSLQYTQADINRNLAKFRDLTWAMIAEARLAELSGQCDEAVRVYLDVVAVARAIAKEGIVQDAFEGWATENRAVTGMERLRHRLTADQARTLLDALRRTEAEREPLDAIRHRETVWQEHGWGTGFRMVNQFLGGEFADSTEQNLRCGMSCQARMRILICELALQLYTAEHGGEPETLAALIPNYLDEVPDDPFTRGPLRYRPGDDGYQVYSVGLDKKDDGG